jgi:Ca-activated chloride channel family protein
MNVRFDTAWILYLLWIAPCAALLWHLAFSQRNKALRSFVSDNMQKKLSPLLSQKRSSWQSAMVATALFLMLIAAAQPQWGMKEQISYRRGRDLVIAVDVSRSMLARDVHPSRLGRAKVDVRDLIRSLRGDRAALLAFRHKANLLCPLTTDRTYLTQSLDSMGTHSAPPGETDIGDAITKAIEAFDVQTGSHRAIVLISDGEDLAKKAIEAAERAKEQNIPIFTVGLGNRQGSRIPDDANSQSFIKHQGADVVSKLNDDTLYEIAKITGGAYVPAATANMDLGRLYSDHLRKLSQMDSSESQQRRYIERYQYFLLPAFLLILMAAFLSAGRLATKSQPTTTSSTGLKQLIVLICLIPLLQLQSSGQTNAVPESSQTTSGRALARTAQTLYSLGQYRDAANTYLEASKHSSGTSQQDFQFNAAAALYKKGRYQEAADLLQALSLAERSGNTQTLQGLGLSYYHAAKVHAASSDPTNIMARAEYLGRAAEAFKQGLYADESSESRNDLAAVLEQLPKAKQEAFIAKLMSQHEATPGPQLATEMMTRQRSLVSQIASALTNTSPSRVTELEQLAKNQKDIGDLWIPLKGKLQAAMSQQADDENTRQRLAMLEQNVETMREHMATASRALRDLDPAGYGPAAASQAAIYQLWRGIAQYSQLLQEDILAQSNTISHSSSAVSAPTIQAEQDEAAALTTLFVERFSQAVPEEGLPASPDPDPKQAASTNATDSAQTIDAETRAKILELADATMIHQKSASLLIKQQSFEESLTHQRSAHELLKEIEELLPKDKQQPEQDQQDKEQDGDSDPQSEPDQKPDEKPEEQPKEEDKTPDDIKKMLEKALEREKEHELEKLKREAGTRLPGERDW